MNKIILIIILLLAGNVYAEDQLAGFDKEQDLPRLNEVLRKTNDRLLQVEGLRDINTSTSGILDLDRGGTGEDLSTLEQGAVWYDNGTDGFARLSPGSAGQVLTSNGAGSDPSFETLPSDYAWTFLESGSFAAVNTFTITETLADDETYNLIIEGQVVTNTVADVRLIFNSDTSGDNYHRGVGPTSSQTNFLPLVDSTDTWAVSSYFNTNLFIIERSNITNYYGTSIVQTAPSGSGNLTAEKEDISGAYDAGYVTSITFTQDVAGYSDGKFTGQYYLFKANKS